MTHASKSHSLNIMLSPEDLRRLKRCAILQYSSMAEVLRTLIRRLDGMLFNNTSCCVNGQMCAVAHLNTPKPSVPPPAPPEPEVDPRQELISLSQTNQKEPDPCTHTESS